MGPKVKVEHSTDNGTNLNDANKTGDKPKAFTIKYKRPRGSRACSVCRSRKVRCDAEIHIPCTNCITFGCECVLPEAKKRGSSGGDSKLKRKQPVGYDSDNIATAALLLNSTDKPEKPAQLGQSATSEPLINISQVSVPPSLTSTYKSGHNYTAANRSILTFVGSSSFGPWTQKVGQNHIEVSDFFDEDGTSLDAVELEILKLRGAFLLPSKSLSLDLIETYFEHIHPLMPVIDRTDFMRKFNDPNDSQSLMLMHAVLLCGCRVSDNPLLKDAKGSNHLASLTFFRRAKALYEANYESDPVSLIQSLILIGSYWEGPQDVTKNSFYWTKVAIGLAQGFGLHRDVSTSTALTTAEKKIWRRIWWCLFEKDRNVAIAFGRPSLIDLNDCDVPMLTLDDFDENDPENNVKSPYKVNETQALYFIHLVKLAEITGIIISHQYTVKSLLKSKNKFSIIQHCDMLMGIWFTNLPPQLVFSLTDPETQNFYSCLLNAQYYNRLFLIHRSNLLKMARSNTTNPNNYKYPSWGISFQAARMTAIVSRIILNENQIVYCPSMFVYIVFMAMMMLIYHVDSPNKVIASTAAESLRISSEVLNELGKHYLIAKILMNIFKKNADNKFKRAKIIENSNILEEYQESNATETTLRAQNQLSKFYENENPQNKLHNHNPVMERMDTPSKSMPYEQEYEKSAPNNYLNPNSNPVDNVKLGGQNSNDENGNFNNNSSHAESTDVGTSNGTPNSTNSFPHISLVTEILPTDREFFDKFEPTQLFPGEFSMPPSGAQSPVANTPGSSSYRNNFNYSNPLLSSNYMNNEFLNMNQVEFDFSKSEELKSLFEL